jgi:hypothetical protein
LEAAQALPANIGALTASSADVRLLYQKLLSSEYFEQLRQRGKLCENNRVYNASVVMWLMINQRLQGGNMASSVLELVCGLPANFWPRPCKRLQLGPEGQSPRLSANTASYNDARQNLPLGVVEDAYDWAFGGLMADAPGDLPEVGGRVFFVDGTSGRSAHSQDLCQAYPPATNQHGASHWPMLRLLVAHDLHTGLAMRPHWGPMYGAEAVSEQGLLEAVLGRLPRGSSVLGDTNFGVFSVAYAAAQRQHPTLLRLLGTRAQRLLGGKRLRDGIDQRVQWRPSPNDRKSHPQLAADAMVEGRVIVRQVQPSNGSPPFLLALFTTLEAPAEALVALYGKRWRIETDLRTLKSTLQLEQLTCTSTEMIAKEILMGMLAYNLVRAVTYVAAQAAGVQPREFSFTQVRNVVNAFAPRIAAAPDPQTAQRLYQDMLYYASRARLPKRRRPRPSYPRAVWPKRASFPRRRQ